MLFASPKVAQEYGEAHPDTRKLVRELDEFLVQLKQPEVYITDVHRTRAEMITLYSRIGVRLLERLARKEHLGERDKQWAAELRTLVRNKPAHQTELEVIEKWAGERPSWHRRRTAVDVRNSMYPRDVRESVEAWLKGRCARVGETRPWELLVEDHGTGPHWHIARRDFAWLPTLDEVASRS